MFGNPWLHNGARRTALKAFSARAALVVLAASGSLATAQIGGQQCDPAWRPPVTTTRPNAKTRFAVETFDDLATVVLYGGQEQPGIDAAPDTWIWDGGVGSTGGASTGWVRLSAPGLPGSRSDLAMAYDVGAKKIVMFGGIAGGFSVFGDTWFFDGSAWTSVSTPTAPPARFDHSMYYDVVRGCVVLFGGRGSGMQTLGDLWEFRTSSNAWTQVISSPPSPAARFGHTMSYDSRYGHGVLFGGRDGSGLFGDTWTFDGVWKRVADPGTGYTGALPAARAHHAAYEDRQCGGIVLHGGEIGAGDATWHWDGFEWKQLATSASPGALLDHGMAWDPIHTEVLLYGGLRANAQVPTDDTWEFCCCAEEAGIGQTATGNPVLPSNADPTITFTEVDQTELVDNLYSPPQYNTDLDTWYGDLPCPPVVDFGFVPDEVNQQGSLGQSLCNWLNLPPNILCPTPEEVESRMRGFEDAMQGIAALEGNPLETAGPAAEPYSPGLPHCVPTRPGPCGPIAPNYVFGGRCIVFVHGLMPDVIADDLFGNDPAARVSWQQPASFPANGTNPEYYGNGYFKRKAEAYWGSHIQEFLTSRNIHNRYLVVSWSSNDRLWDAAQAVITQINDAMQHGTGVRDPLNPNGITTDFGNPSFVLVTHSAGSLVADIAMAAAADTVRHPNLNASYIPQYCKAHIAVQGAFGGSRIATAVIALSGYIGIGIAANFPWLCYVVDAVFLAFHPSWATLTGGGANPCVTWLRLIDCALVDLVPAIAQNKWGPYVERTPVKTLTVAGGHPTRLTPIKHILNPGLDDGLLPMNSQLANPNQALYFPFLSPGWPTGFRASGGLLAPVHLFDRHVFNPTALNGRGQPTRAVFQFFDQWMIDPRLAPGTILDPLFSSGSAVPWLSQTGMLQPVGYEYPLNGGRNPLRRAPNHLSFIQSTADHIAGAIDMTHYPNYLPTPGIFGPEANDEEVRVITDPGIYTDIPMPFWQDNDPLLRPGCAPPVEENVRGRKVTFRIRFGFIVWEKTFWLWKRTYYRLVGWQHNHQLDYVYKYVLTGPAYECPGGRVVQHGNPGIGMNGPVSLAALGLPDIGTTFGLRLSNAAANVPALFLLGFQPIQVPINPPAFVLYTLPEATVMLPTDAQGVANLFVPIPNDPFLRGALVVAQGIALEPTGAVVGSNGLILSIQ